MDGTMSVQLLLMFLQLHTLVLTGVHTGKVYIQSAVGRASLLPCHRPNSTPGCSSINWTFYKAGEVKYSVEVSGGHVRTDSDKWGRLSLTQDCSLDLRDLKMQDSGSYVCLLDLKPVTDVYLSILTVSSPSTVTELRPGGHLVLRCVLHTFYDAGSCKDYSSVFNVSWVQEDGTTMASDHRFKLMEESRCNVSLVMRLHGEDQGRRWRCQANHTETSRLVFVDTTVSFLFGAVPVPLVSTSSCPHHLPISRIILCTVLPLMVLTVALVTWRRDHNRGNQRNRKRKKGPANSIEI